MKDFFKSHLMSYLVIVTCFVSLLLKSNQSSDYFESQLEISKNRVSHLEKKLQREWNLRFSLQSELDSLNLYYHNIEKLKKQKK